MDPDSYLSELSSAIEIAPPSVGAIIALILAGLCLLLSGFVSASEIGFFSLSGDELQQLDKEDPRDRTIISLLENPEKLLATILIYNNLVNVTVVILCNLFFSEVLLFKSALLSFIFQTIILTFLLLLFGEVIPKFYSNQKPLQWARFACNGIRFMQRTVSPLANLLVRSTNIVNKHVTKKNANLSINELSQALEMTKVEAHDEKEMLEGIITFGRKTVQEVMIARVDMTGIEIRSDFKHLLEVVIESGYSRIPVYDGSEDDIKGILYSKDLLPYINKDENFDWRKLIRRAYFVPETKMIDDLLEEFRTNRIHMAIVVDEFGGTSGIVTMEDLLEEIVGEISDEFDEEEKQYTKIDDYTYVFEAKILLNDFYKISRVAEEEFGEKTEEVETLAGLLLSIKEDFPKLQETINFGRCHFTVLEIDKRRILKIKVRIDPTTEGDNA